jgi:hypothetical protein
MSNYSLIKDGVVVNTIVSDDDFIQKLIQSGEIDSAELIIPPEPPPVPFFWYKDNFRDALSLQERVNWDNNAVPEIVTVKAELEGAKNRVQVTELLDLLLGAGAISQESYNNVLALDPNPDLQ